MVVVERPTQYPQFSPTAVGIDRTVDSNGVPSADRLTASALVNLPANNSSDQSIDFGFYGCQGVIGNFVWVDTDRDDVQDVGEPGIPGVRVELSGPLGFLAFYNTDGTGGYQFTGLCAGNYTVTVTSGVPADYTQTLTGQGGDPTLDSNGSPALVTLPTDFGTDLTIDLASCRPSRSAIVCGWTRMATGSRTRGSRAVRA